MNNTLRKSLVQLEDLRRREQLSLSADGPMVRLFGESQGSRFGHLPTMDSLVITTPLGHYKTKIAELGLNPQNVMCQVASQLAQDANNFAFHDENTRAIGSRMYYALKHVVTSKYGVRASAMRVITDTFPL